jgi:serine/threonine protein kinase/CHASE2 domain-containing sensor protein
MRTVKPWRRALALLVVALLATGVGVAVHLSGALDWLGRSTVDARFSLRGAQSPPDDVVVVGIDNDSIGNLPRYPFSRRLHARAIENLHRAGARLIVYDVSFDRPTTAEADDALFEAARKGAPVVFATSLISPSGSTQVLGGDANLAKIGDRAAAADLPADGDGTLRHLLGQVNGLPTLALATAQRLHGIRTAEDLPRGAWIDYPGPPGTIHNISFAHVLDGHFDRSSVRGKVVVVGATASLLQDLHDTAAGSPMSGAEVQAAAISTALDGFPLRSGSAAVNLLLIGLLGLSVPALGLRLGAVGVVLAGVGLAVLWSLATQFAFDSGVVLDYVAPMAALLLATGATALLAAWSDSREHKRLRMLFAADARPLVEDILGRGERAPLAPTAIVAGYAIERVLGRGGMGVVYSASQLAIGRSVAIKLIAPERTEDPMFRERFKAESRIAASIEHANVIPVYEAGEDDGLLFIAMRLVDGIDLAELLRRSGPLHPARAARLVNQLAGALDAAHARRLVHRDVKPANALVTHDEPEHIYLTDFGVAKELGAGAAITQVDQWVGTLDYLAPEQIRGEAITPSVDIYALTGVLYHCLTGAVPYPRENEAAKLWAHINADPVRPSAVVPSLPESLDAVIARGMAKDPAARYENASGLARACQDALGIAPEQGRPPSAGSTSTDEQPLRDFSPTLVSQEAQARSRGEITPN